MLFMFLLFIVLCSVITVITEEPTENIPSEFNYFPDIIAVKSR